MIDRAKAVELMKAGNKDDEPIVETDLWAFLSERYPDGNFYRVNALAAYVESKGGGSLYGFFREEGALLETLRSIADHYGWVKARENSDV